MDRDLRCDEVSRTLGDGLDHTLPTQQPDDKPG
jgi:hypothetical protein